MTNIQFKQTPKAQQFTAELNSLLAKYQYLLEAEIQITTKGVTPLLVLKDVLPPKGDVKMEEVKPTPEQIAEAKKVYKAKNGDKEVGFPEVKK